MARTLGVAGIGQFSSALSLLYIFQAFCSLGFTLLVTRDVAQERAMAGKYLVNASLLGLSCSVIMIPIMWLAVNVISADEIVRKAVYLLSFSLIPYSVAVVCESICRAFERLEYVTISEVGGSSFRVGVGLLLLFKGHGFVSVIAVIAGSYCLQLCVSMYFVMRCTRGTRFSPDAALCRKIARAVPMFAGIVVVFSLRWNIDILILTRLMSQESVGYYGAAMRLFNIAKLSLGCFVAAVQPVIFRLYSTSRERFALACEESIRYLLIIMIPIAAGTAVVSERFVLVVFGSDFLPSAQALRILIWILVFSGENLVLAHALIASGYQRVNLYGNLLNLAVNVGLNVVLIPRYGFVGASIASLLSSIAIMAYQWYVVSRRLFKVNFVRYCTRPVVASGLMVAYVRTVGEMSLPLLVLTASAIYFLGLIVLGTFGKADLDLARGLVRSG